MQLPGKEEVTIAFSGGILKILLACRGVSRSTALLGFITYFEYSSCHFSFKGRANFINKVPTVLYFSVGVNQFDLRISRFATIFLVPNDLFIPYSMCSSVCKIKVKTAIKKLCQTNRSANCDCTD